jgi:hypothetical protein
MRKKTNISINAITLSMSVTMSMFFISTGITLWGNL